ncbi:Ig-like domain-containing protein [Gottfriedia luciferensis]|uniref:Ig-like domain-containing protein n=1 Tax=Gottfriedia luciferensis TaxID=178774 RepID=UPI000B42FB93|nr:Ig-like domain-containing protein [Gottfriedia luciferensis]
MAFTKNKKIITSTLTAAMVASAVAPVAAATQTVTQAAEKAVKTYEGVYVTNPTNAKSAESKEKAARAAVAKLTSAKYKATKAKLLTRIENKKKGIQGVVTKYNAAVAAVKKYEGFYATNPKDAEKSVSLKKSALNAVAQLRDLNKKASLTTSIVNKEKGIQGVVAKYHAATAAVVAYEALTSDDATKLKAAQDAVAVLRDKVYKEELSKRIVAQQAKLAVPTIESAIAVNASQIQISFNKAVDSSTIFDLNGNLNSGVITVNSLDSIGAGSLTGELSADGKTLTVTSSSKLDKRYDVIVDKVKTADKADFPKKTFTISVSDQTRPTFSGVTYLPNGNASFTFSEPIDATPLQIASAISVAGPTNVTISASDVTLSTNKKSFSVALPTSMNKDQNYTFTLTGLKDFAGNLLTPNPVSVTVAKKDVDSIKPTVTSVASVGVGKVAVTFSEQVSAASATLTVNGVSAAGLTTSIDNSKTVVTFNTSSLTAGVQSLVIGGVKDLAGNTMDAVTKVVEITADTTAPLFVSQSIKTVSGVQYLVLNYNEDVTVDTTKSITGTYVGADYITRTLTPITGGTNLVNGADGKSIEVKLPALTGDFSLNLPVGIVKDTASNATAARTVTFKLGTTVDTTKPVVSNVVQTNSKVLVSFDREVSASSALNLSNYAIEGISSPFEGTAIFKGDARTVELTLRPDAITTTGARIFTVQNVSTGAGAIMVADVKARNFVETVRPTVVSARVLDSKTIEVTFSEAVKDGANAGADLAVFQGTSTSALAETSEVISGNKILITLANTLTTLNGLQVKAQSTIDLTDLNNNAVNFTGIAVQ